MPLLYDDDCGFCTRAAGWAEALLPDVEVRAISRVDLTALGVDPGRANAELPYVAPDGQVSYGSEAIAAALRTRPGWTRLVGRGLSARPVRAVAQTVYRWVAAHRHRLPGGTPACRVPQV